MERSDCHRPVAQHDADLSACDEGCEPHNPSLDEPWEPSAADALVRLYESGDARAALQSPFGDGFRERLSRLEPGLQSAAVASSDRLGGADCQWLETKLAGIAHEVQQALAAFRADPALQSLGQRFNHFEKRFESALANVATRTDVEGLKLIEAHVSELFERADAAKEQLSHLLVVEAQLAALKANLSDERMSRLASALAPSQQELARMVTAAAETAVQHIAGQPSVSSDGGKTHELLSNFIEERRRSEQLAGEALETMQQAMQHILDRLDSIEMTQSELLGTSSQGSVGDGGDLGQRGETSDAANPMVGSSMPTREMVGREVRRDRAIEELTLADLGLAAASLHEAPIGDGPSAPERKITSPPRTREAVRTRVSAKTFPGAGILLVAGLSAFVLAGYWLVSGISIGTPLRTEVQSAEVGSRPAGKGDVLALKPSSSEAVGAIRSEPTAEGAFAQPQAGLANRGQSNRDVREKMDQPVGAVAQAPMGMVIEQNPGSLSPEEIMRMRQRQRMANLSTRLGQQQQALETGFAADRTGEQEAGVRGASVPSGEDTVGVILEMPPLTIGPQSLRIAAAKGDPSAQFDVAARFAEGKGVKQDFAQAALWYQRAATQGLAAAQYRLAALYERGLGVTADTARARVWYKRAAEQGNLKAMHNMAVLSVGKEGTASDYEAAAKWFTEAAEHGVTDSQYNLGVLLESGLGVSKDPTAAYRWYALAARGGDQEAVRRMDRLRSRMSPAAIKAIEAEIAAWRPRTSDALVNDAHAAGEAWKTRASAKSD